MSKHHYDGPIENTRTWYYVPVALLAIGFVALVFASGVIRGLYAGKELGPKPVEEDETAQAVNVQALAEPTDELVAAGRQVYNLNCASCHGPEGFGDGNTGQGLNPKPRNFHEPSPQWTRGASVAAMWDVLQNGLSGTSMASYSLMPLDDRIAVIHYIRERWVPDAPELTDDDVAALPGATGGDGGGTAALEEDNSPPVPIEFAVNRMTVPERQPVEADLSRELLETAGAKLWGQNCADCHGPAGGGVPAGRVLQTFPYTRVATPPIIGAADPWVTSEDEFSRVITTPSGGFAVHDFANLTREEISELHEFVKALVRQERQAPLADT